MNRIRRRHRSGGGGIARRLGCGGRLRREGIGVQPLYGAHDAGIVAAALHVIAGDFHDFVDEKISGGWGGREGKRGGGGWRDGIDCVVRELWLRLWLKLLLLLLLLLLVMLLLLLLLLVMLLLLLLLLLLVMLLLLPRHHCFPFNPRNELSFILLISKPPPRLPHCKLVHIILAVRWFVPACVLNKRVKRL